MSASLPHLGRSTALALLVTLLAAPTASGQALPPAGDGAVAALEASPRHGEWVTFDAGGGDPVEAWIAYPERSDAAPVVVVIHEIFGMSDWIRSVADRLAGEGFIAIAPDMLSGKGPGGGGTGSFDSQSVGRAIRDLDRAEINRRLRAAGAYALALPASGDRVGAVGFCWGGSTTWLLATDWPELDAAVVYYGSSPETGYESITAPVLGLFGGNDNRVNATIDRAEEAMAGLGRTFEPHIFEGAGHGFLRQQNGQDGANLRATREAWPLTVSWFREYLGR